MLALIFFGPPLVWVLVLSIRARLLTRRAVRRGSRSKVTVANLQARIEREQAERTDDLSKQTRRLAQQAGLPAGWVWPERDRDTAPQAPPVSRRRRYVHHAR